MARPRPERRARGDMRLAWRGSWTVASISAPPPLYCAVNVARKRNEIRKRHCRVQHCPELCGQLLETALPKLGRECVASKRPALLRSSHDAENERMMPCTRKQRNG